MKKKRKGFTLVELVIVIAVIAVLAAVLVPTFSSVMDKAHDSADLQLVRNMNTVMSTNLDENVTATAENLRKYLKDNGITDIGTKNSDVVIVYNKTTKQFERMNVKKTLKGDEISVMRAKAETSERFTENPYSVEEIFSDRLIVSTSGNDLAEAMYALHTFSADVDGSEFISGIFAKIDDSNVANKVASIINSTVFVTKNDDGSTTAKRFSLTKDGKEWKYTSGAATAAADRVVFNEELTSFDVTALTDSDVNFSGLIVIPDSIEEVKGIDGGTVGNLNGKVQFTGNIEALDSVDGDVDISRFVIEGSVENAKEGVAKLGGKLLNASEFYVKATDANKENLEFGTVQEAIAQAQHSADYTGKEKTVVLTEKTTTLSENITIPKNVTLSIPYSEQDGKYLLGVGYGKQNDKTSIVDDDLKGKVTGYNYNNFNKYKLELSGNITIENGGKLVVGGVTSYPGQNYNGHTSGDYAKIDIKGNGSITVGNGGKLECYGYIKGGSVVAENGSKVTEPFIVTDYTGGGNTVSLYFSHQSPFLRYAMLNIQSELTIKYGALLYAHCNLYASGVYNTTNEVVIGYGATTANTKGLITLENENSYVVCTYEAGKYVNDDTTSGNGNNLKGDIGKTTVTVYGDARTESLSLLGLADTKDVIFPVPFNFNYVIASGNFKIKNQYVILPGASVTVESGATLTVTQGASFYVMDYLNPEGAGAKMVGKSYPTNAMLSKAELETSGIFTVKGTFVVKNGTQTQKTKVGGIIRAAETGTLIIGDKTESTINGENIDTSGAFQIGSEAMYATNTATFKFPLRVFDVDSVGMADYKVEENKLKLANVSVSSEYTAKSASAQNISEKTTFYAYEVYDAKNEKHTGKEQIVAAGGTYVNAEGTSTVTIENVAYGFEQTTGSEAQVTAFKVGNYNYTESKTFEEAVKAIDAYYALSPKARQEVKTDGGFNIDLYSSNVVSGLFKKVEAYAAAFATTDKDVEVALAGITAANAVDALSDNVKRLLSEDITGLRATLNNDKKKLLIFSVSYSTADAGKFTSEFTQGEENSENKIEKDGNTTMYYMASQANGLDKKIEGYQSDNNKYTYGTTDPYGTLFYEAWQKYVVNAAEDASVTFTLYTDIKLLKTPTFKENQELSTYNAYSQLLTVPQNRTVDFNLNGHDLIFMISNQSINNLPALITNSGKLTIHDGNILGSPNKGLSSGSMESCKTFVIQSSGNLDANNLVIECGIINMSVGIIGMSGIKVLGDNSHAVLRNITIASANISTLSDLPHIAASSSSGYNLTYFGVAIDGGEAELYNIKTTQVTIGIIITKTNNTGVKIVDSNITAAWGALLVGSNNAAYTINITGISGCQFMSKSSLLGRPITIDGSKMASITIGSITDCKFLGMFNSIQIKGKTSDSGNNVTVGSITSCSIIADDLADKASDAPVALELVGGVTISSMSNTTIAAIDNQGSTKAVAVSVGEGCTLNFVLSEEVNNYFSVSGNDNSTPFVINGTVTMNQEAFALETNLTSEPEMYNGYMCHKLQPTPQA